MFVAGFALWIGWTLRHAARTRTAPSADVMHAGEAATGKDVALFVLLVSIVPIYFATRLAGSSGITPTRPKQTKTVEAE